MSFPINFDCLITTDWITVPCSELVCAKCENGYKTFKNLLELNALNLMTAQSKCDTEL